MPRWAIALIIVIVVLLIGGGVFLYVVARTLNEGLEKPLIGLGESLKSFGESFKEWGERFQPRCARKLPFKPRDLSKGFNFVPTCPRAKAGTPHGLARFEAKRPAAFIDVYRNDLPFVQTHRRPIEVLGSDATIGWIHEGFSVEFTYRGTLYGLYAFGLPSSDLRAFAEGLAPVG